MITKEEYQKTLIRMWDSVRDDADEMGKPNCDGVACEECYLYKSNLCKHSKYNAFDVIDTVEKWGKEHPIKTNREVFAETLKEKFGDTIDLVKLQIMLDERGCDLLKGDCISDCKNCYQSDFWDDEYKEVNKDASSN